MGNLNTVTASTANNLKDVSPHIDWEIAIEVSSGELYPNLVIVAGTLQLDDVQIIYNVHKIILHEYFVYDLFGVKIPDNDIALALVREPFIFNNLVSPICLPDDRHFDMDTVGNCWVTGWQLKSAARGPMPPIYHMVKQNVGHQTLATCRKFYPENLRKNVICVMNWDKKQSLCLEIDPNEAENEGFFDMVSHAQSNRMDDQRCNLGRNETPSKKSIIDINKSNCERPINELLDLLADKQGQRLDDQRVTCDNLPGLQMSECYTRSTDKDIEAE
ncbi:uncharacterized protein LOC121271173 [Carcharodon carcharias]|uniref:uncharacterized protein LOC121271173 n=1 Tax=Carcharodon carcharias TaxID=13397 RepID=UPI001B7E3983|nr:uncharacterized protein LOC121271173 [Carcharodon carcharias]